MEVCREKFCHFLPGTHRGFLLEERGVTLVGDCAISNLHEHQTMCSTWVFLYISMPRRALRDLSWIG
jgi:hypothetical protein